MLMSSPRLPLRWRFTRYSQSSNHMKTFCFWLLHHDQLTNMSVLNEEIVRSCPEWPDERDPEDYTGLPLLQSDFESAMLVSHTLFKLTWIWLDSFRINWAVLIGQRVYPVLNTRLYITIRSQTAVTLTNSTKIPGFSYVSNWFTHING